MSKDKYFKDNSYTRDNRPSVAILAMVEAFTFGTPTRVYVYISNTTYTCAQIYIF